MKYCLDTSALIDLGERYYPERIPIFTPIWEHIYQGVDDGDIISVDYVKSELEKQAANWRENFFARAGEMFLISQDIEIEFSQVIERIENLQLNDNRARDRFMNGADPWVIALAQNTRDCTVVSSEKKNLAAYGLGAICGELNIPHIDLIEFFETNNIGV